MDTPAMPECERLLLIDLHRYIEKGGLKFDPTQMADQDRETLMRLADRGYWNPRKVTDTWFVLELKDKGVDAINAVMPPRVRKQLPTKQAK